MKLIYILAIFSCVSSTIINNSTNEIIKPPELIYQRKLRNSINSNTFKEISSYKNNTHQFYIEIITKYEYFGDPLSSKLYRMGDKIKLSPKEFLEIIEFIAKSTTSKQKSINSELYVSRFENPFYVTIWKPVGLLNSKYRLQVFDWIEIKELLSVASNILYITYRHYI